MYALFIVYREWDPFMQCIGCEECLPTGTLQLYLEFFFRFTVTEVRVSVYYKLVQYLIIVELLLWTFYRIRNCQLIEEISNYSK